MSTGVLQQIDLDLVQCEMFASSEPVPGMEEGVLVMCFLDLRQLLDLFVSWDWSTYFADFGKSDSSRWADIMITDSCICVFAGTCVCSRAWRWPSWTD
jgi:hypothetical protein